MTCPVCNTSNKYTSNTEDGDAIKINCELCGEFKLVKSACTSIYINNDKFMYYLREYKINNNCPALVDITTAEKIIALNTDLNKNQKNEKLSSNIFKLLEGKSTIILNAYYDYPLAWTMDSDEFITLLEELCNTGVFVLKEKMRIEEGLIYTITRNDS